MRKCPHCNKAVSGVGQQLAKGVTAHRGCVVGRVQIVRSSADLLLVSDGDILVTRQTSPEAVPAMVRAGAVVTDLGGILCHAAIVCREFGKACIVGAGEATVKLQTGGHVLVAACTGEVFGIDSNAA